jgi:pyruvate dehydrogenase E2 component (dihydrolipoamide acetyltransferase)
MVMSKAVAPHTFSVVEIDYNNVDKARNAAKGAWKVAEGFSLTYLPFISRAIVDAINDFPHMNASISGDQLIVHNFIDLGIAVDMNYQGLLVPVVRSAEGKRLRTIARETNDLATRTRSRKLSPDEITGGTFTISNNGSAGSVLTSAIINQPQVAIISTDAIVRKPVVVEVDGDEHIAIHSVGFLSMTWDHRAFDGAYAANFLVKIKHILETRDWSGEL